MTQPANSNRSGQALIIYTLLTVSLTVAIFIYEPPSSTRLWQTIHNFGHTPAFGVLAVLLLGMVRNASWLGRLSLPAMYLLAGILALAAGFALEVYQIVGPRDADFVDLLRNLAGVSAFLALRSVIDREFREGKRCAKKRTTILLAGVLILLVPAYPVFAAFETYRERDARFPVLADADAWRGRWFLDAHDAYIEVARPEQEGGEIDRKAFRITFLPDREYPGVEIAEPYPDWSGYGTLTLSLLPVVDSTVNLTLAIYDSYSSGEIENRITARLKVHPSLQTIQLPLRDISTTPSGRPLDYSAVSKLNLYTGALADTLRVWITDIRLR